LIYAHTVTNTYEVTRNVLDVKANVEEASSLLISQFDYSVNALGQRDDVNRSGSAFASANTETWNYNTKGEVVTADHSTNNAFDRSFQFDGIGNRKSSSAGVSPASTYTANALNQYSGIDGATRTFDDDGNLTDDGTKQFVWDAENRLIEVKNTGGTVATYAYDYQARRISKTIGSTITSFVYDGWNPIAEFSGTTLSKSYTWGMDLSGSMQGAGGVGGLLAVNETSASYYPTFDGNGNVSEYVDATGTVVAHYEYDAFGQAVASGTKADDFSHQFSTKQLDAETGLHYYGYRYYNSSNGRWLGRDPIGERGGVNLYGFVFNGAISTIDILGLKFYETQKEARDAASKYVVELMESDYKNELKSDPNAWEVEFCGFICCNKKEGIYYTKAGTLKSRERARTSCSLALASPMPKCEGRDEIVGL